MQRVQPQGIMHFEGSVANAELLITDQSQTLRLNKRTLPSAEQSELDLVACDVF